MTSTLPGHIDEPTKMVSAATSAPKRKAEADPNDFWRTPKATVRQFLRVFEENGVLVEYERLAMPAPWKPQHTVLEPCCGEGHMAEALGEYFHHVTCSDLLDRGFVGVRDGGPATVCDFAAGTQGDVFTGNSYEDGSFDWVISNPPYGNPTMDRIIANALRVARVGVAMLVPLTAETGERMRQHFSGGGVTWIVRPHERISFYQDRVDSYGKGADRDHAWWVWIKGAKGRPITLVCQTPRLSLIKPGDDDTPPKRPGWERARHA